MLFNWNKLFTAGAARLHNSLQTCLADDDPPFAAAQQPNAEQSRADLVFFTIFGVLVSVLGVWVLYLQSLLARTGF